MLLRNLISDDELHADYVIPDPFDRRVVAHVASAVAYAAMDSDVARKTIDIEEMKNQLLSLTKEKNLILK
jgi:malate dehydrogenase (oxaloacetate-decarboxylating)